MTRLEHLLTIASEECNETAQRITKALRFGMKEIQPEQPLTNAERIIYEFNDLVAVMELLQEEGHISFIEDRAAIVKKKLKVIKYLKYSDECGTLTNP